MAYEIIYTNELYHHGIKGQKWGTRRWQNSDGSYNEAGKERYFGKASNKYQTKADKYGERFKNSKTFIGRGINNKLQYKAQVKANVAKSLNESKGIKDVASNLLGAGRRESGHKAAEQFYKNRASAAKTRLGKTINESKEYNAGKLAKAENRIKNSKDVGQYIVNTINKNYNTTLKTWSGRKTKVGNEIVLAMLTGGLYETVVMAQDIGYYIKSGNENYSEKKKSN